MDKRFFVMLAVVLQLTVVCLTAEEKSGTDASSPSATVWMKVDALEAKTALFKTEAKASSKKGGESSGTLSSGNVVMDEEAIKDAIDEAAELAVRNEEAYINSLMRNHDNVYRQEINSLTEQKLVWKRASLIEGGILLLGTLASVFVISRTGNR